LPSPNAGSETLHVTKGRLDSVVGCAVAASVQGAVLAGVDARSAVQRRRVRLSELQRKKRW